MLKEFKDILEKENIDAKDMAKTLGITYGSYRTMTMSSNEVVPKWVTSFVMAYRLKK
jgi:hypothetical protein